MPEKQPNISDYAFISNCHSSALISNAGSIDWCCMPDFSSGSLFGRLLDMEQGGHCSVEVKETKTINRQYVDGTLIVQTTFESESGILLLTDFLAVIDNKIHPAKQQLFRYLQCLRGYVDVHLNIEPRFDYGAIVPWFKKLGDGRFTAIGGNDGLVITSDSSIQIIDDTKLFIETRLNQGNADFVCLEYINPARLEDGNFELQTTYDAKRKWQKTKRWWHAWRRSFNYRGDEFEFLLKSAVVLKGLCFDPAGSIIAAPTTSLPEKVKGSRNWDYRYSWIRDSVFTARAMAAVGFLNEADRFSKFIQRSAAGHADTLQIMYGIGGQRRLSEEILQNLEGYRSARPVRVGNAAHTQKQLDCYGTFLQLIWHWHQRGASPDDDSWRFLTKLINTVCETWDRPGQGFWESREKPKHYVYSKIMCWVALDYGIKLSEDCLRKAPLSKWRTVRHKISDAINKNGVSAQNYFVEAFSSTKVDGTLLLIPHTNFVDWNDEIMIATCDQIMHRLDSHGMIRRNESSSHDDGTFVACTFWLAECLAKQGRLNLAMRYFRNGKECANSLGLFSEERNLSMTVRQN